MIAHKASQPEGDILVEDTSLDIEGASVGVNVRWLIDHIKDYVCRKAKWTVLLAARHGDQIYIYKGTVQGRIY